MMVGRSINQIFPKREAQIGPVVLDVSDLSPSTEFDGVGFSLHRGEILGFYGLVGAGRSEVMQALFGLTPLARGTIRIDKQPVSIGSPQDAIARGIAYVPEDRQHQAPCCRCRFNTTLPCRYCRASVSGCGAAGAELSVTRKYSERLELKATHFAQAVAELSGGNQQKVVLAKWLATNPKVIILDEPTKGIDIGSKAAVHKFMTELVAQGLAVILVSSELPEVLGMSDRVVVMYQGRICREFSRADASSEALVAAASGGRA